MPKTIRATDAVRSFSDILNSVKYRHESFTIIRGGKPAAVISPVEKSPARKTLGELKGIMSELPRLGKDAGSFMRDIEEAIHMQPKAPEETAWE